MPPAFNLSQDQTLQFNHCKVLTRLTYYCQCEHFVLLEIPLLARIEIRTREWHSQNQVPTPIGCKLLKNARVRDPLRRREPAFAWSLALEHEGAWLPRMLIW